jgi:NDP-sugar pyrophosphorylase family protein
MSPIKDCKAMIFAAGLGTRLKPFTDHHPKALARVNGKSLLERNLEYLNRFGIVDFVINTHHFADQINAELKKIQRPEWDIAISYEADGPFETGGGLAYASKYLNQDGPPFIVMNVDILTNLDLIGMFEYHQKIKPLATLAVTDRESSRQLLFDDEMKLVGWKNNHSGEVKWVHGVVDDVRPFSFSGIHVIHPNIFKYMPADGIFSMIDVYLKIAKEELVIAYDHSGDLVLDVGKPNSLIKAEEIFE